MRAAGRFVVAVSWIFALSAGVVQAEQAKMPQPPPVDPAKQAALEAMQRLASPSDAHKALEPFVGNWTYTAQWWTVPDAKPETMTGTAATSLIFGGRFLKQEIRGTAEGQPPFEGVGFTGYDNVRKTYQTVWFDNMMTGMMVGTGQFDAETSTLSDQGTFSCPMTGQANRSFRSTFKVVDANHVMYESYMDAPQTPEFKTMEIRYTRAQ